jgi:hypothetical protein
MNDFGQNFRAETDPDGVHIITWDMSGRSMNVIDEPVLNELDEPETARCFAEDVLETCKASADELGPRYRPPDLLLDMARQGDAFYRRFPPAPAAA